jgi:hypothetical protein
MQKEKEKKVIDFSKSSFIFYGKGNKPFLSKIGKCPYLSVYECGDQYRMISDSGSEVFDANKLLELTKGPKSVEECRAYEGRVYYFENWPLPTHLLSHSDAYNVLKMCMWIRHVGGKMIVKSEKLGDIKPSIRANFDVIVNLKNCII